MKKPKINLPIRLVLPILLIAMFSVYSFATSVSVTSTTVQSQNGILFNVTGGFTVASNGFSVVQSTSTASTQPATWSNGGTVKTALTAGHWYYSLTLTINAGATVDTTYTVTVTWNTGSGYGTLGSALTLTTPDPIVASQTMNFFFDTGLTSFNAPTAITITVA